MRGYSHLIDGTFIGVVVPCYLNMDLAPSFAFCGACMLGSLLPDIDLPTSTLGRIVPLFSRVVNKVFGHRGFIHTPLFILIMFALLHFYSPRLYDNALVYNTIAYGILCGRICHLILDACTINGIMFLYPFVRKRFSLLPMKSGSNREYLVLFINMVLSLPIISLFA